MREGRYGKVKSLQWLLTHSHAAKLLAVRRVSQNKGSKTAGTDGVMWRTDNLRLSAVGQLKHQNIQVTGYYTTHHLLHKNYNFCDSNVAIIIQKILKSFMLFSSI